MTTGGANYSARRVPCLSGRPPLKCVHEELAQALLDIDAELADKRPALAGHTAEISFSP